MGSRRSTVIAYLVASRMHRAKLEGRRIGRTPLDVERQAVVRDRRSGMSLRQAARKHGISRASVGRLVKEGSAPAHTVEQAA